MLTALAYLILQKENIQKYTLGDNMVTGRLFQSRGYRLPHFSGGGNWSTSPTSVHWRSPSVNMSL